MTSLFSYLITIFSVIFWFFRIFVTYCATSGQEFICEPLNVSLEIAVLFLSIPCFVLVFKRSFIGATLYLAIYALYFGSAIVNTITNFVPEDSIDVGMVSGVNLLVAIIGIVLPLLTFLDILFNKNRLSSSKDKEGDWYYKNEKYDREMDERADRNQYKIR